MTLGYVYKTLREEIRGFRMFYFVEYVTFSMSVRYMVIKAENEIDMEYKLYKNEDDKIQSFEVLGVDKEIVKVSGEEMRG